MILYSLQAHHLKLEHLDYLTTFSAIYSHQALGQLVEDGDCMVWVHFNTFVQIRPECIILYFV